MFYLGIVVNILIDSLISLYKDVNGNIIIVNDNILIILNV